MENKLTINDLPCEVVDEMRRMINEDKQMVALKQKKNELIKGRRFIESMKLSQMMKDIENRVINQYLSEYEGQAERMDSLIKDMTEEDREDMNTYTNSIISLADMMETFVMEINQLLKKYHPDYRLEMFDKLTQLGKEAKGQVKFMSEATDMNFQCVFADNADNLTMLVLNKVRSFNKKLHNKSKRKKKEL